MQLNIFYKCSPFKDCEWEKINLSKKQNTWVWNIVEFKNISQSWTGGGFNSKVLLTCELPSSEK